METEEFDRNIDENDEPVEGTETGIANPGETDESEMTGSAEPGTVAGGRRRGRRGARGSRRLVAADALLRP
jgi:hypothetical protein